MRLFFVLAVCFSAVISRADQSEQDKIQSANASLLTEAKRMLNQLKTTPSDANFQKFIDRIEQLKQDNQNDLYIDDNGKETSFYMEINRLIDEALSSSSKDLFERLYSHEGYHTKRAAQDGPAQDEKALADKILGGFYTWHTLCLRYAFTPTGIKYFDKLVNHTVEYFVSKPEDYEVQSATKTDTVSKAWRVMKLGDRLLEVPRLRDSISTATLLKLGMVKASYGDVRGVEALAKLVKDRGPDADLVKVGGQSRSLAELFSNLETRAQERLDRSPGLTAIQGAAANEHIEKWAKGGAIGDPVLTDDGNIVVGWRNREAYYYELFTGVVVLDKITMKPLSYIDFGNSNAVYKAGTNKFWVDTRNEQHESVFVLIEYDPKSKQLKQSEVTANVGGQAVFTYGTPLWVEKTQTLIFPLWDQPGVAWLKADKGLEKIWRVPNPGGQIGTLLGPPNSNIFLKDASSHITSLPAINEKTGEIVVGSHDGRVFVLNERAQLVAQFQADSYIRSVAFLSDGRIVAGGEAGNLYWLKRKGNRLEEQYKYQFGMGFFLRLTVLSDDQVVVPARYKTKEGTDDNRITWVKDGKYVKSYTLSAYSVMAIENDELLINSPDGWLGWMKPDGTYLRMQLAVKGAAPIGNPVRGPDGGFLVWSETAAGIFWMTPWEQFQQKVLWPTAQQGLVNPF